MDAIFLAPLPSSQGIIIVYDITRMKSFDGIVNYWLRDIKEVSVRDCMEVCRGVVKN